MSRVVMSRTAMRRTTMQAEFTVRQLVLALLLVAPVLAMADSKSAMQIELDAIVFKENGRFHPGIVEECSVQEDLRQAMTNLIKVPRRKASASADRRHVTLRVDKIGTLGSVGRVGTEIGVTAILAGQDTGPLFLCRDRPPFRPTHCARINHCARQIAEDAVNWLNKLPPAPSTQSQSNQAAL
jgi:hypothetical protein